jgi:hypothetical protein
MSRILVGRLFVVDPGLTYYFVTAVLIVQVWFVANDIVPPQRAAKMQLADQMCFESANCKEQRNILPD